MSNEILPGKLSANSSVSAEAPVVMEKKKENRKRLGGMSLFLLAVGLGAVALASITLLAPVAFYGKVDSPGGIEDASSREAGAPVITSVLSASAMATDGEGKAIDNNGSTKSDEMTITGYSDGSYRTGLTCGLDGLPAYCANGHITFSGLPPGEHVFTMVDSSNDQIKVQYFNWGILK